MTNAVTATPNQPLDPLLFLFSFSRRRLLFFVSGMHYCECKVPEADVSVCRLATSEPFRERLLLNRLHPHFTRTSQWSPGSSSCGATAEAVKNFCICFVWHSCSDLKLRDTAVRLWPADGVVLVCVLLRNSRKSVKAFLKCR